MGCGKQAIRFLIATWLTVGLGWFVFYEFAIVAVCDGSYELTIEVDTELAREVTSISYVGVSQRDVSSIVAAGPSNPEFVEIPDRATPFAIHVGTSERASNLLGHTWGYVQQYSHIVVALRYSDGTQTMHVLPIPHKDVSTRLTMTADSVV